MNGRLQQHGRQCSYGMQKCVWFDIYTYTHVSQDAFPMEHMRITFRAAPRRADVRSEEEQLTFLSVFNQSASIVINTFRFQSVQVLLL